jgi:Flp pilus assembly protein TadD
MSLINNMLKDLEKRESLQRDIPYIGLKTVTNDRSMLTLKNLIIAVSVCLLIVLSFYFISKRTHQPSLSIIKPIVNTNVSEQITAQKPMTNIPNVWLKPVVITGMTLQVKDNITELTLMLNHAALYRVISDGMRNQVSFVIDHAELQAELPTNAIASAIQHISSQQINTDTRIDLTLFPNASIKYVNLNTENKNAELVIAIENRIQTSSTTNTSSTGLIKTPAMQDLLSQQYQSALNAAAKGDVQTAVDSLTALIKMDPAYHDARVSLVALLMDQSNPLKAKHFLDEGLRTDPDYLPFIELKARIFTVEGKTKEALAILLNTPPPMADNPEYHAFIAALYQRSNSDVLAIKVYRQLLALNPHNGNWWFGLGVSLDKIGHGSEATQAYTTAATEGHLSSESISFLQKRLHSARENANETG